MPLSHPGAWPDDGCACDPLIKYHDQSALAIYADFFLPYLSLTDFCMYHDQYMLRFTLTHASPHHGPRALRAPRGYPPARTSKLMLLRAEAEGRESWCGITPRQGGRYDVQRMFLSLQLSPVTDHSFLRCSVVADELVDSCQDYEFSIYFALIKCIFL